ncbi:hypothetical protein HME01_12840 [Vreelandella aquamarina]|nr:hypothetical protein HME01_12840 [Halomonas meridiana]
MEMTATLIMQVATIFVLVAMGMPMALLHILMERRLNANHARCPMRTRLTHTGDYQARQEQQQKGQIAKAVTQPIEHVEQPGLK